jgi:hypothetical protein
VGFLWGRGRGGQIPGGVDAVLAGLTKLTLPILMAATQTSDPRLLAVAGRLVPRLRLTERWPWADEITASVTASQASPQTEKPEQPLRQRKGQPYTSWPGKSATSQNLRPAHQLRERSRLAARNGDDCNMLADLAPRHIANF